MFLEETGNKYKYIDVLVQTVQTFSADKVMEFEIKKYGVTTLERVNGVTTEGIKLSDRKVMKRTDDTEYKFPGV